MMRDADAEDRDRENGAKGGNPNLIHREQNGAISAQNGTDEEQNCSPKTSNISDIAENRVNPPLNPESESEPDSEKTQRVCAQIVPFPRPDAPAEPLMHSAVRLLHAVPSMDELIGTRNPDAWTASAKLAGLSNGRFLSVF